MSNAQRSAVERTVDPAARAAARPHYDAGGQIAALQANLARQLREQDAATLAAPVGTIERWAQALSRTGGYAALALGYAVTGVAIVRFL
jgi:hypothetical protein